MAASYRMNSMKGGDVVSTLEIRNLSAGIAGNSIINDLSLIVNTGEIHALLGPNGHGKSTLLNVIMGNPLYEVYSGDVLIDGQSIINDTVDQRARKGIFLAMQYPQEIPGVSISDFMRTAINANRDKPITLFRYIKDLETASKLVGFEFDMVHRSVNEGFSGGEKKRNEILQMLLLKPKFALLDEVDSGLDVDALNLVTAAINQTHDQEHGYLVVSHYARMYHLVQPTHVHVVLNGHIAISGGVELVNRIDQEGYHWLKQEYGLDTADKTEKKPMIVMQNCAAKTRGQPK